MSRNVTVERHVIPPPSMTTQLHKDILPAGTPRSATLSDRSSHSLPTIAIGASLEQGARPHMEDRATAIKDLNVIAPEEIASSTADLPRSFLAVYDGHSSAQGSEHAARRVHQFIAGQPQVWQCTGQGKTDEFNAVEAALKRAFDAADDEIIEAAERSGKRYGSTAVCALLVGRELFVAHAGDSKAVLLRAGAAVGLTRDHKPASVPEERRRIEAQGGKIAYEDDRVYSNPENDHPSRLNMSRALGDAGHKFPRRLVESEPDVAHIMLRHGEDEFLILGSDGLFDVLSGEEVVRIAKRAYSTALVNAKMSPDDAATQAADVLVTEALQRGSLDNVTAAIMTFSWK